LSIVEVMEPRRLLSQAPVAAAAVPNFETTSFGTQGARYVKRVNDDLLLWLTEDGSGIDINGAPLPLEYEMALGGGPGDDVITFDMAGGDFQAGRMTIEASAGGDRVRVINGEGRTLTVVGIPALNGKKLDLGVADLRIRDASLAAVEHLLGSARNDGPVRWHGPGIGTSAATPVASLAPVRQGVDVLVRYSYNGDVNGDGRVNADDYFRIDSSFGCPLECGPNPTYFQGDLNFDDTFNADDYFLIDSAFLGQGEPLTSGGAVSPVPADPDGGFVIENEVRYLKRVGNELYAWASADGSGAPIAGLPLPLTTGLTLGDSASDDVILIDMSGGDIMVEGTLAMAAGAGSDVIRVVNGDGRMLAVGGVQLNGGKLDLGTSDLKIINGDVYEIEDFVGSARNLGTTRWQGPGIGTTAASSRTGLAPLRQGADVLVRYVYDGDMYSDGQINADDYFRIDSGFLAQPPNPLYGQGDLNFDDKIDADDYSIIDRGFLPPFDPWPL
jgi:hypothetical protein